MTNVGGNAIEISSAATRHLSGLFLHSILPVWIASVGLGFLAERFSPITSRSPSFRFNMRYMGLIATLNYLLSPAVGGGVAAWVSYLKGGWIPLPQSGISFPLSVLVLLATKDFLDYWVHRAQHRYEFLWKMHSLHHSDPSVNVTTAQRHFWLERIVFTLAVYPVVGIIFRITPALAFGFSIAVLFWSFFPHMNLRLSLGRFSPVFLGPQVHRLHHSILPEHFGCNYAGVFPLWDVLFGTYKQPHPGEFPETGVTDQEPPQHLLDAVLWPVKRARL
jgi:sterol desaturase/sphingolipid hydroxylase (fatty acid hydroxylase superfamily)